MVVVLIVGVLVAVQFGRQVYANWESGQRVTEIEAQIAEVDAVNARLQEELDYLRSEAYISAEARRLANLGAPGEEVGERARPALQNPLEELLDLPGAEEPLPEELLPSTERPEPLLRQWVDLFFGEAP